MAKAKKLPSGRYRVLVYVGKGSDGKRKYESFTADTRREAEFMAAEYMNSKTVRRASNITVKEAMDRYIASKENVLSPSTVREYKHSAERDLKMIHNVKISNITQEQVQIAINTEAKSHSPKTVRNIHALLSASLCMFMPNFKLNTTLPQMKKSDIKVPTDKDIKHLLSHVKGKKIEIPILLAAVGSLRRSEISALSSDDVDDQGIHVNKAMVKNEQNKWVIKLPKTNASDRYVPLPKEILSLIKAKSGNIVNMTPDKITRDFRKALKECKIAHFKFHALRHYFASVLHSLNVPDEYIMEMGGWETDSVLKKVYRHTMSDKSKEQQQKIIEHFNSLTRD